ncbi:MAG: hypothetical protein LBK52_04480 [Deltaproteobacteria bacterium]|jgi:energy-coupling factor transport system permease protein|nr:hypothetical protein [Deltaproteobacteria bacterium]
MRQMLTREPVPPAGRRPEGFGQSGLRPDLLVRPEFSGASQTGGPAPVPDSLSREQPAAGSDRFSGDQPAAVPESLSRDQPAAGSDRFSGDQPAAEDSLSRDQPAAGPACLFGERPADPGPGPDRAAAAEEPVSDEAAEKAIRKALGLDPETGPHLAGKLLAVLAAGIGVLVLDGWSYFVFSALLGLVFLIWLRQSRLWAVSAVLELAVLQLTVLFSAFQQSFYLVFLSYLATLTGKFIPIVILSAAVYRTSGLSQFMALCESLKLPAPLTVAATVTLRFTATMLEEYRNICESRKLRGLRTGIWGVLTGPVRHTENIIVPLALRCARLADELTASALTRGLEHRRPAKVRIWSRPDLVLTAWAVFCLLAVKYLSGRGFL